MNHFKQHATFYGGLLQLLLGYAATVDLLPPGTVKYLLAASGLITVVMKYIQVNLPDDPKPVFMPYMQTFDPPKDPGQTAPKDSHA